MPPSQGTNWRMSGEGPVRWHLASSRYRSEMELGFAEQLVSKAAWRRHPMYMHPVVLDGVGLMPHTTRTLSFQGPCRSLRRVRSNSTGLGGVCAFVFS